MAEKTSSKKKAVKKAAIQKPAEDLVLKKAIHIPGWAKYNDGKLHAVTGAKNGTGHFAAGTIVTEEMVSAYDAACRILGGETPITKFCL